MGKWLDIVGNIVGVAGILVCVAAGIARLVSVYYLLSFENTTLIIGGTALMVMACLIKLQGLTLAIKANP